MSTPGASSHLSGGTQGLTLSHLRYWNLGYATRPFYRTFSIDWHTGGPEAAGQPLPPPPKSHRAAIQGARPVDCLSRAARAMVPPPRRHRTTPQGSTEGPEVLGWTLLPAAFGPCRDRILPARENGGSPPSIMSIFTLLVVCCFYVQLVCANLANSTAALNLAIEATTILAETPPAPTNCTSYPPVFPHQ